MSGQESVDGIARGEGVLFRRCLMGSGYVLFARSIEAYDGLEALTCLLVGSEGERHDCRVYEIRVFFKQS